MNRAGSLTCLTFLISFACLQPILADPPRLLDDQFNLPPGFHIYKAADLSLIHI